MPKTDSDPNAIIQLSNKGANYMDEEEMKQKTLDELDKAREAVQLGDMEALDQPAIRMYLKSIAHFLNAVSFPLEEGAKE